MRVFVVVAVRVRAELACGTRRPPDCVRPGMVCAARSSFPRTTPPLRAARPGACTRSLSQQLRPRRSLWHMASPQPPDRKLPPSAAAPHPALRPPWAPVLCCRSHLLRETPAHASRDDEGVDGGQCAADQHQHGTLGEGTYAQGVRWLRAGECVGRFTARVHALPACCHPPRGPADGTCPAQPSPLALHYVPQPPNPSDLVPLAYGK